MDLHLLLLPLFFLTFFTTITALPHLVLSVDSQYEACAPKKCNSDTSQFSYPFWIPGQHPSYCGEPGFEISCEDNRAPIFSISGKYFVAVSVFFSHNSLLLVDEIAYKGSCGVLSLDGTPFVVASGNYNLYFFYNCTTQPGGYPVSCATDPSLHSFAYFFDELTYFMNYSGNCKCQSVISTPVDVSANASSAKTMSSINIVKNGFLVNWKANNCSECEGSGGRCGFEYNGFVCFCPDGAHQKTGRNDRNRIRMKIGIAVGAGAGFVAMMSSFFFVLYVRHRMKYDQSSVVARSMSSMYFSRTDFEKESFSNEVPIFDYGELAKAMNNFDPVAEHGVGGFGTVFKGKLRDGRVVAVKRLYEHNSKRVEQFMNEVNILTGIQTPSPCTVARPGKAADFCSCMSTYRTGRLLTTFTET